MFTIEKIFASFLLGVSILCFLNLITSFMKYNEYLDIEIKKDLKNNIIGYIFYGVIAFICGILLLKGI